MNDKFNFFVPLDDAVIEKAAKAPIESRYKNMVLEGRASDGSKDIDDEILEPSGYVVDYFLKAGYANYEHLAKKSPKFLIGTPTEAKIKDNEFHVKVKLWENSPIARDIWDKIIEMKEGGVNRLPGWSIEGKSLARDPMNPKRITKALITGVALTFSPVNQNTFADIAKGNQSSDYVDEVYEVDTEEVPFIFEFEKDGKKYRVGKDFKVFEVIAKAMDTAAVKPMTPESLEGKTKNIALMDIKKALDNVLSNKQLRESCPDLVEKVRKKMLC
jgi:hypothetical protein